MKSVIVPIVFILLQITSAWKSKDKILLTDLKVITLHSGRMTNARRSSPVPHLKCVGGSAGCHSFMPQTVQCYNRGSDGYDVQWECKTDMDNEYRFGKIEVSCEGYDYPDDPYVLKGSCGLEYTLDHTKAGHERKHHNHDYGYEKKHYHSQSSYSKHHHGSGSTFGHIVTLGIIALIVYVIYKTCLSNNGTPRDDPPPYGFRPEYTGGHSDSSYGCNTGHSSTGMGAGTGGGFWTGAATGGILGYLFGNRTNTNYYSRPYYRDSTRDSFWGGWGTTDGGSGWSSRAAPSAPTSSGTRTASGFGGTKRR